MSVDYNLPLFQHPLETWPEEKCQRLAKRIIKDGLGTPYPKGYLNSKEAGWKERYNGGCSRNGEWWQGEEKPTPIIPDGYYFETTSLGIRIVKK